MGLALRQAQEKITFLVPTILGRVGVVVVWKMKANRVLTAHLTDGEAQAVETVEACINGVSETKFKKVFLA